MSNKNLYVIEKSDISDVAFKTFSIVGEKVYFGKHLIQTDEFLNRSSAAADKIYLKGELWSY